MIKEQRINVGRKAYEDVFDRHDYVINKHSTEFNINQWANNKENLINLLATHPNWSEDDLAIILPFKTIREVDTNTVKHILENLVKLTLFKTKYTWSTEWVDHIKKFKDVESRYELIANCLLFRWCIRYDGSFGDEWTKRFEPLVLGGNSQYKFNEHILEIIANAADYSSSNSVFNSGIDLSSFKNFNLDALYAKTFLGDNQIGHERLINSVRVDTSKYFANKAYNEGKISYLEYVDVCNVIDSNFIKYYNLCGVYVNDEHREFCDCLKARLYNSATGGSTLAAIVIGDVHKIRSNITPSKLVSKIFQLLEPLCKDMTFNINDISEGNIDKKFAVRNGESITYTYEANLEQIKAIVFDLLKESTIDNKLIMSVNPGDFLTQSHGNSWQSCHSLRSEGCYCAGTLSLMADPSSIICYLLSPEKDGKLYNYDKLSRVTLYADINSGVVINNQVYPQRCQNEMSKYCREIVEELISNKLQLPNLWTPCRVREISIYDGYNYGYNDYYQQSGSEASAAFRLKNSPLSPSITIGAKCYYADSTDILNDNDTIFSNGGSHCEYCGNRCHEDDLYYVEGYGYVCEDCLDNSYFYRCEHCDNWYHRDRTDYVVIDDDYICEDCALNMDFGEDLLDSGEYTTNYFYLCGEKMYTRGTCEELLDGYILEHSDTETALALLEDAMSRGFITNSFYYATKSDLVGNEEDE